MEEPKEPYFSSRVRIADVTSPKDLVGLKEMTVEVTFGNQETRRIESKEDLADIHEEGLFDFIENVYQQRDKWAKERGFTFVDQVRKYQGENQFD